MPVDVIGPRWWLPSLSLSLAAAEIALAQPAIFAENLRTVGNLGAIAPGQVLTLYVQGLRAPEAQAAQVPWPRELAGVRVTAQDGWASPQQAQDMPVFRIQRGVCGSGRRFACEDVSSITVQVPTDLPVRTPPDPRGPTDVVITVWDAGIPGYPQVFRLDPAAPAVLNECHRFLRSSGAASSCEHLVTHADGTLVTSTHPARPGETIVLYAVGLGLTAPVVAEGQAAPAAAPRVRADVRLAFSQLPLPSGTMVDESWARPEFAGLVPGFVGLYQVNVRLPGTPPAGSLPGSFTLTLDAGGPRTSITLPYRP